MNKSKIEYIDYSWNPITGCLNGCDFCYARKLVNHYKLYGGSFKPQLHSKKLIPSGSQSRPVCPVDVKTPSVIFIIDMGDLFSQGILEAWRKKVREAAHAAPQHTYLWLTKRPNYTDEYAQPNWWQGISITNNSDAERLSDSIPVDGNTWISYEPLFGLIENPPEVGQVVIGRATNYNHAWCGTWASDLTRHYQRINVPVFQKDNIKTPGPKDLIWAGGNENLQKVQ